MSGKTFPQPGVLCRIIESGETGTVVGPNGDNHWWVDHYAEDVGEQVRRSYPTAQLEQID